MINFTAENVFAEDFIQNAEEHTRELQIEEAFKIFQNALELQKDKRFEAAHAEYDKLFAIDVVNSPYVAGLPPSVESLRYLAFKNHGLLLLNELKEMAEQGRISPQGTLSKKSADDDSDSDDPKERLEAIVDEFAEALLYDQEEDLFIELFSSLSFKLGYKRIARMLLENIATSDSRALPLVDMCKAGHYLGPMDVSILYKLKDTLVSIGDQESLTGLASGSSSLTSFFLNPSPLLSNISIMDLDWLPGCFDAHQDASSLLIKENNLEVTISSPHWLSVITGVQECFNSLSKQRKRNNHMDPYSFSTSPANCIKFVLPNGEVAGGHIADQQGGDDTDLRIHMDEDDNQTVVTVSNAAPSERPPSSSSAEVEDESKKKKTSSLDEALRARQKRVRIRSDEKQTLETADVSEDESFFEQITAFVTLVGCKFDSILPVFLNEDFPSSDQCISDLKVILSSWDDEQAEIFMKNDLGSSSPVASPSIDLNLPLMQMLDFAALGDPDATKQKFSTLIDQDVEDFLRTINNGRFHLQEVRVMILRSLLGQTSSPSLFHLTSNTQLLEATRKALEQCEPMVFQDIKNQVFSGHVDNNGSNLEIAETVFEMFVDQYIGQEKHLRKSSENLSKQNMKELEILKVATHTRVLRWKGLCNDILSVNIVEMSVRLRHQWVLTVCGHIFDDSPEDTLDQLEEMQQTIEDYFSDGKKDITFIGFTNIPKLSVPSVRTQISKLRAASVFAKAFDDRDESTIQERIAILESILIPKQDKKKDIDDEEPEQPQPELSSDESSAISQFLESSSLEFRHQLWRLLLDAYDSVGETQKSFDGYMRILMSVVDGLSTRSFSELSENQRHLKILRSLNILRDIGQNLVNVIVHNEKSLNNVPAEQVRIYLESIIRILRMLHMYILLEDAIINNIIQAPSHPSWERTSAQFKEMIVISWTLFYLFYRSSLSPEKHKPEILNDILSIIHEEIGTRGYCGMADGAFLDVSLKELLNLNWSESEADMLQCMHCRYGLAIGNDDFFPFDHHTTPDVMDKKASLRLVRFFSEMVSKKRNFSQVILRSEVKSALEQFQEGLGIPKAASTDIPAYSQNLQVVDAYLDSYVSPSFFQNSLRGREGLSFAPPGDILANTAGKAGFYYIQGQVRLSLFRIRKRTTPGRTEDVDEAIKYFKYDLMCNSNRFETWISIAQCYDALAEDGMTWNADKINGLESKKIIASNQRRAILASGMAVSVHLQSAGERSLKDTIHGQQLLSTLWTFCGKMLYNSTRPPLSMSPFVCDIEKTFCGPEGFYTKPMYPPFRMESVLSATLLCMRVATSTSCKDWHSYYVQSSTLHHLKAPAQRVFKPLLKALEVAPEKSSHGDVIIEPGYKMTSMIYKYLSSKTISAEDAASMLRKVSLYEAANFPEGLRGLEDTPTNRVYADSISTLIRIRQADKRKWHHRPTYRLARIYAEIFQDFNKAREEMATFFTVKAANNTKSATIHIWKPSQERPGQHFEFIQQYVVFYVSILEQLRDLDMILTVARGLRRFSSGLVRHQETWEFICNTATRALKAVLDIPQRYSELHIPTLSFDSFDDTAQRLTKFIEDKQNELPLLMTWLNYCADFRRLNNGFGSTAALDDIFVSVYLRIHSDFALKYPAIDQSVNTLSVPPTTFGPSSPATPTKISVSDLIEGPAPVKQPPSEEVSTTGTKIRVTRREIITRALALLRSALPKFLAQENAKKNKEDISKNENVSIKEERDEIKAESLTADDETGSKANVIVQNLRAESTDGLPESQSTEKQLEHKPAAETLSTDHSKPTLNETTEPLITINSTGSEQSPPHLSLPKPVPGKQTSLESHTVLSISEIPLDVAPSPSLLSGIEPTGEVAENHQLQIAESLKRSSDNSPTTLRETSTSEPSPKKPRTDKSHPEVVDLTSD